MDADEALDALPPAYAQALRLRADGMSLADIAAALDVPPDAMDAHLLLAEAKLARLLRG